MAVLSEYSLTRLNTCHPDLQRLVKEAVKHFDCRVLCGHRNQAEQDQAFHDGNSETPWPRSKHNTQPSVAVDVAPYPIDWKDTARFHYFAGFMKGLAVQMGIRLRWGGDWDSDTEVKDETFRDLVHFELVP